MGNFYGISPQSAPQSHPGKSLPVAQEEVFEFLRPKHSPCKLIRLGGNRDGAYLLPDDLGGVAACFSPGVKNKKDFEDELATSYAIPSHMCDKSSDPELFRTPLIKGMQTFRKVWLDIENADDAVTLSTWISEDAPAVGDLLLQMDIEGAEYRILLAAETSVLSRFRIIVLEIHALHRMNDPAILLEVMLPLVQKLGELFYCVHVHPNNASVSFEAVHARRSCPRLLEITLLRKDRFPDGRPISDGKLLLPHPLDIPRNVWGKPPIFLDEHWLGGAARPPASIRKIAEDEEEYRRFLQRTPRPSP
jgi:hypothetical protein